jgi:hypothetical protein
MGGVVIVEFDKEVVEVCFVLFMHAINKLFGLDIFGPRANHNRGAVSIVGAEVETLIAAQFLEADPDIGL